MYTHLPYKTYFIHCILSAFVFYCYCIIKTITLPVLFPWLGLGTVGGSVKALPQSVLPN